MDDCAIQLGLTALAHAGAKQSAYLGHFGSAMLSAYFMCRELNLPRETIRAISTAALSLKCREPQLFRSFSSEKPDPNLIEQVRLCLTQYGSRLSRSGHSTIIGMFVLKAFHERPDLITPTLVQGVTQLMRAYGAERSENRYYGFDRAYNEVRLSTDDSVPRYRFARDALKVAIREVDVIFPDLDIGGVQYYFMGEKLHAITHGHAIYELHKLGHADLVAQLKRAHRLQVKLNRHLPPSDTANPLLGASDLTPMMSRFWEAVPTLKKELALPHAFKRSYALLVAIRDKIVSDSSPALHKLWYMLQL